MTPTEALAAEVGGREPNGGSRSVKFMHACAKS